MLPRLPYVQSVQGVQSQMSLNVQFRKIGEGVQTRVKQMLPFFFSLKKKVWHRQYIKKEAIEC